MVLSQPWGGLGDNLQFTTLPRLYSQRGIEFYLSNTNRYMNEDIYDVVWKYNPYVKGISDDPPNIGAGAPNLPSGVCDNVISASEIRHGFSGDGRYPEIYYKPNKLNELYNTTIVDFSAISTLKYGLYNMDSLFKQIENNLNFSECVMVYFKKNLREVRNILLEFSSGLTPKTIEIESLAHYADVLYSSKSYYSLHSGGHCLAAGIKNKYGNSIEINCFLPGTVKNRREKSCYVFDNVNYIEIV